MSLLLRFFRKTSLNIEEGKKARDQRLGEGAKVGRGNPLWLPEAGQAQEACPYRKRQKTSN
jgi:hypothetical protein